MNVGDLVTWNGYDAGRGKPGVVVEIKPRNPLSLAILGACVMWCAGLIPGTLTHWATTLKN